MFGYQTLSLALTMVASWSIQHTEAHSWVHCTNYNGPENVYNEAQCSGYPRCGAQMKQAGFGVDVGMDTQGRCQCHYAEGAADYAAAPKAQYNAGQTVCLAYPPKNHAASAANPYIPDGGVKISRTALGDTTDTFTGATYEHMNGVHENGVVDMKGFQKCPEYESDNDKSLCTMCFQLEADIAAGEYSFSWEWEFNGPGQLYTTCWEARVGGGADASAPTMSTVEQSAPETPATTYVTPTAPVAPAPEAPEEPSTPVPAPTTIVAPAELAVEYGTSEPEPAPISVSAIVAAGPSSDYNAQASTASTTQASPSTSSCSSFFPLNESVPV